MLAQKEICPNLTVQTDPTGGGDRKTDTETYPVADEIADKWFEGIGRKSSSERWAFAISAKKVWKPKVKSDVKKIVDTNRGYVRIYFMSNQAISDKKKADTEDALKKEFKVDVHIIDRLWIIEKIYENNRFDIAVSALNFSFVETEQKFISPNDQEKILDLKDIEKSIDNFNSKENSGYQYIEDCLHAAILSRELEKPKDEVYGRFDRAKRLVDEYGAKDQLRRIIYQYAWTSYWWYDDAVYFSKLYNDLEKISIDTGNIWDINRLCTLMTALHNAVIFKHLNDADVEIDKKYVSLLEKLKEYQSCKIRKNIALTADLLSVTLKLTKSRLHPDLLPPVFTEMKKVLEKSDNLLDVPIQQLVKMILEISEYIGDVDSFDDLLDTVLDVKTARVTKSEKGELLTQNGYRKLRLNKNYEAIKLFGEAIICLSQEEDKLNLIKSQIGLAHAYEETGLVWAARSSFIFAVHEVLKDFSKSGEMNPIISTLYKSLMWLELKLGRISNSLVWLLERSIVDKDILGITYDEAEEEDYQNYDSILVILILKTKYIDLLHLSHVPSLFDKFGLIMSRFAALYALGYEDAVKYEYKITEKDSKDIGKICHHWINQPVNSSLPPISEWGLGKKIILSSQIVGVKFTIELPNSKDLLSFAESFISSLEAFLATAILRNIHPVQNEIKCVLDISINYTKLDRSIKEDSYGDIIIYIHIPKNNISMLTTNKENIDTLMGYIGIVANEGVIGIDSDKLKILATEDSLFSRVTQYLQLPIIIDNIFSDKYLFSSIKDWEDYSGKESFTVLRDVPWSKGIYHSNTSYDEDQISNFSNEQKHTDFLLGTVINVRLWDKAIWKATLFVDLPHISTVILGVAFKHKEEGIKIFKGWIRKIGKNNIINISIVTGIDKNNPAYYKVIVSANNDCLKKDDSKVHLFLNRTNKMTPTDSSNLDLFKKKIMSSPNFFLVPSFYDDNSKEVYVSPESYWIKKSHVTIIEAWKISMTDVEVCAITKNTNPIIPQNISHIPVLEVMEFIKNRK